VIEDYGADKDYQYKNGIREEQITEAAYKDADGVKHKEKKTTVEVADPNHHSIYACWFDEANRSWSKNPEYNNIFLQCQQNYANDMLHAQGHLFLNEVYDMLGVTRSEAGALVGWVMSKDGDNFVDFGIFEPNNPRARAFVNRDERSILLDFNVDGIIFNLIENS
jgi:hypothetical protein